MTQTLDNVYSFQSDGVWYEHENESKARGQPQRVKPRTATKKSQGNSAKDGPRLKTWDEVEEYMAKHLKPVGHGPKGQPIYDYKEAAKLNIHYPDDPD